MNRRQLFALGAGLVIGEPARRAYSFLDGFGLDLRPNRQRMMEYIQAELAKHLSGYVSRSHRREVGSVVERFLEDLKTEPVDVRLDTVVYYPVEKRITCTVRVPTIFMPGEGPFDE